MPTISNFWSFFTKKSADLAQCQKCSRVIKTQGGSTSGLKRHLQNIHPELLASSSASSSAEGSTSSSGKPAVEADNLKQRKLDFGPQIKYALDETVARLTAESGFSFRGITECDYLRHAMARDSMKLPKKHSGVTELILQYHQKLTSEIQEKLAVKIRLGERFSITTDEWTSGRGRRYFNVNIHGKDYFRTNLGLVLIQGSFTSEVALDCVRKHLAVYGIDFKSHCVGMSADGAAVMKKFGRISPTEYQGCFAHALHLGVCDVLYNSHFETDEEYELYLGDDSDDCSDGEDGENSEDIRIVPESSSETVCTLIESVDNILKKVRSDVKRFRKSPKDNEVLQKHAKDHFMQELKLILDVKTRWSSIFDMLSRYCKLRPCLQKTFIDLNGKSAVSEEEFVFIQQLCDILNPIKLTSDALCRNDATLLSADAALEWLVKKLSQDKSSLGPKIHGSILNRIRQRRNPVLVALTKFLHNGQGFQESDFMGVKVTEKNVFQMAEQLFERLDFSTSLQNQNRDEEEINVSEKTEEELDIKSELQKAIDNSLCNEKSSTAKYTITADLKLHESQKQKTNKLDLLYNALLTIKPTSVEAERTFSVSGNFATKIRSTLNSETLSALVCLKCHFKELKNQQK